MARSFRTQSRFDIPAETLVAVLADKEFLRRRHQGPDILETKVRDVSRTDGRAVVEVETLEHAQGMTGRDRKKTERNLTTYDWDLAKRTCRWHWRGPHGDCFQVGGTMRIEAAPAGVGGTLLAEFSAAVCIPLLGGQIEKKILAQVEQDVPRFERLLKEFLAERRPA